MRACFHTSLSSSACTIVYHALPSCTDQSVTGMHLGGKPASCPQLASYCNDGTYGAKIRSACPKTCNTCPTVSPGAAACSDVASTGVKLHGKPASCLQLAPYCKNPTYGAQFSAICPRTCAACPTDVPTAATVAPSAFPTFSPSTFHDLSSTTPTVAPSANWLERLGAAECAHIS